MLKTQGIITRSSIIKAVLVLFAYFLVSFAVYQQGLYGPMIYDSGGRLGVSGEALQEQGLKGAMAIFPDRPVVVTTFYLNFLMDGLAPEYYRLVNIFLLACTGALVCLLVVQILSLPVICRDVVAVEAKAIGVAMGLLFVIHPLQMYMTLYIWQRFALMACLFSYGSIAVYIAVRKGTVQPVPGYVLCFCLFFCGLASKENAVVTPAVFLLAELILFRSSFRNFLVRAAIYGCGTLSCVFLLSLCKSLFSTGATSEGFIDVIRMYYASSGLTVMDVILTQARILFRYIYITLVPTHFNAQLIMPQIVSESLFQPGTTILACVGVLCLVVAAVWLMFRRPLVSFGIAFYVLSMLPESLLVPQYAYFGYRAIFPMLGLIIAVADPVLQLVRAVSNPRRKYVVRGILSAAVIGACLFMASIDRDKAREWSNPILWWEETVRACPHTPGKIERKILSETLSNLGDSHIRYGIPADAVEPLKQAVAANPTNCIAQYNLGSAYYLLGEFRKAETHLHFAAILAPDNILINRLLAQTREKTVSVMPGK